MEKHTASQLVSSVEALTSTKRAMRRLSAGRINYALLQETGVKVKDTDDPLSRASVLSEAMATVAPENESYEEEGRSATGSLESSVKCDTIAADVSKYWKSKGKRKYVKRKYVTPMAPPKDMAQILAKSARGKSKVDYVVDEEGLIRRAQAFNCSSIYKGVSLKRGRWVVQMTINGEQHYLGSYSTEREAALKYADEHRKAVSTGKHVPMKSHTSRGRVESMASSKSQSPSSSDRKHAAPTQRSKRKEMPAKEGKLQADAGGDRANRIRRLHRLSVSELKEELEWRLASTAGPKADLIARLDAIQAEEAEYQRDAELIINGFSSPLMWSTSSAAKKFSSKDVASAMKGYTEPPIVKVKRGYSLRTRNAVHSRAGRAILGQSSRIVTDQSRSKKRKKKGRIDIVVEESKMKLIKEGQGLLKCAGTSGVLYSCNQCGMATFQSQQSLSRHKAHCPATQLGAGYTPLTCPKCGKSGFKNGMALGGHKGKCKG